jgi:mannose-6-phosphate isomerase
MSTSRFTRLYLDELLPLWLDRAFDREAGQFMEGLEIGGGPQLSGIVRTRTAARQIYTFAHTAHLGLAPAGGLAAAEAAFDHLDAVAWAADGRPGYARAFDRRTREVTDPPVDLYDQACALLALAWLAKATGNDRYRRRADDLLAAIEDRLAAPAGGFAEDDRGTLPRRQNPHMHLFEACLALWETAGPTYADRARALFELFRSRFLDETLTLREFFGPEWQLDDAYGSDRLDPGHMAEWTWLVHRYDGLSGESHADVKMLLLDRALAVGRAPGTPFLADEVTMAGKMKDARRLWLQAELLKAYLVTGRRRDAGALAAAIADDYLTPSDDGPWRDCFDLAGRFNAPSVPGSSIYHLWTAVAEIAAPR